MHNKEGIYGIKREALLHTSEFMKVVSNLKVIHEEVMIQCFHVPWMVRLYIGLKALLENRYHQLQVRSRNLQEMGP